MSDCKDCPKTDIQLLSCNNHTQMQQQQPVMENKPVPFEQNPQPMQPIQPMQSQPDQLPVPSEQKRTSSDKEFPLQLFHDRSLRRLLF
jgi:hypothetical protein